MQRQRILRLAKLNDDPPVHEKFLDLLLRKQPGSLVVHARERRALFQKEFEPDAFGIFFGVALESRTAVDIEFFDADGFEPFQLAERPNIASKPCCIERITRTSTNLRRNSLAGYPPEPHIGDVFDNWRGTGLDRRLDVFRSGRRTMSRSCEDCTHHTWDGEHRRHDLSQSHSSSHPGA